MNTLKVKATVVDINQARATKPLADPMQKRPAGFRDSINYFSETNLRHTDDLEDFLFEKKLVEIAMEHLNYEELKLYILWLRGTDLKAHLQPDAFRHLHQIFMGILDECIDHEDEPKEGIA